jgi:RNA polymerase sigma-70 factor (ECF subfamily)
MFSQEAMSLPPQALSDRTSVSEVSEADDAALVEACLEGNSQAFDRLVRRHTARVFNYLLNMMRHRQDAEDVAQQTFIKAFTHLASFDRSHSFIAWLLTIARRTALNHFRSAKSFEAVNDETACVESEPASDLERKDRLATFWDAARRELSQREYDILWLRYAEDMPVEETARIMGLNTTHTKIIAFRARQRLSKLQFLS